MNHRSEMFTQRLEDIRPTEKSTMNKHPNTEYAYQKYNIMVNSILSVHVIDGRELIPLSRNRLANAQVRLQIEDHTSKTKKHPASNDPVWNEVIAFDILTGREPLRV